MCLEAVRSKQGLKVSHYSGTRTLHPDLNSCEKFQLNTWTPLPNMQHKRSAFNPCLFHGVVYLSGCEVLEAFSPELDALLPVHLPLPESTDCCVYVANDLLVLRSHEFIVKFEAGRKGRLWQVFKKQIPRLMVFQSSQPVVDTARGVLCFIQGGIIVQVDMATGAKIARV